MTTTEPVDIRAAARNAAWDARNVKTGPGPKWKTPAERARSLGLRGIRLPTPFETFNKATRGGPLTGRVVVVGGAPGAGKTTMLLQIARHYALQGHHVCVLAADEEADGLAIRWGQQEGLSRDDLEAGQEQAREWLAARFEALESFFLIDQDEHDDLTLDFVAEKLGELTKATGRPGVLIADSIQTLRAAGTEEAADNERRRIDIVMKAAKKAAKVHGHLVMLTSEMARGFYRSKDAQQRTDALAAFKESGSIEYGVGTALALVSVPETKDLVDVIMAKNRLGEKLDFRIELDRARAKFDEVDTPDEDEQARRRWEALKKKILAACPQPSKTGFYRVVGGKRNDVWDCITELIADGQLVEVGGMWCACTDPKPVIGTEHA